MGGRSKLYKPLLALLILGFLFGVSFSQRKMNEERGSMGLTRVTPLENAPPMLAFTTVALGGFRGLIANALWIRASELQENDKYFEAVQLADWITKLQPQIAAVWVHQAWNMAYNISIKFTEPRDRWMWVKRGIELLRDEGLRYNPNEPSIYRELGWFYQHKIGFYMDDAHQFYKEYWAKEMIDLLGPGRPDFDELINPTTPEMKERSRKLREVYKMDPVFMRAVDQQYGPLEWKLPESHAIYWASLGLVKTSKEKLKKEEFITLRRVVFQSLQLAFHRGKLIFPYGSKGEFLYGPNLDIVRQTSDAYEEMANIEPEKRDNVTVGHKNFLKTAVYFLYTYNRKKAAQEWFDYLKKSYPDSIEPGQTMEEYALSRVAEDVGETDPHRMRAILEGLYETAFFNYAIGEEDPAVSAEAFAKKIWQRYMSSIGNEKKTKERMELPPLNQVRSEVLKRMFSPTYGLDEILRRQLRTRLELPDSFGAVDTSTNQPPPLLRRADQ